VDVAAAAFGGTLLFRRAEPERALSFALPPGLEVETWWTGAEASTPALVARVFALRDRDPARFQALLGAQALGAEAAARALRTGDAIALVAALALQRRALGALGDAAGAPIVPPSARFLAEAAEAEGAAALPAGAGGGDVLIFAGSSASSAAFRALAEERGHRRLELSLGARGVHAWLKGTA
jgi:mevalonate kinase